MNTNTELEDDTKVLQRPQSMRKPFLIVIAALVVVFGGIFGWKAFVSYQIAQYMANMPARTVTVSSTQVQTENWVNNINAVGGLNAVQGIEVASEVPGKITVIAFESGHHVEKGALLVQLDATAEQAQLRALKAELQSAKLDYARAQGLVRSAAVSQAQLDRTKAAMESLEAQVDGQAELVGKKSIRAPFSGDLGIRQVDIGEYVSPGTEIVSLQSLNPIYADFTLPERHLNDVKTGQQVDIIGVALEGKTYTGTVTAVSPKIERTTRNVRVQATFDNPDGRLRPGMFVQVSVVIGGAVEVTTLPQTAISFLPYGNSVWLIVEGVKDKSGAEVLSVESQLVNTGRIRHGRVEIVSGLDHNAQVVNTGQMKLRNGQFISVDNSILLPGNILEP
ncbi:MAG: efflux RND transporter periplasmic adaptor subunit [Alphaproteobacteria bacterium]|nr:MAG: efflux RND transporter periplasmic adaptor subunit [Alphaproteobacteria bacterium]